jgi:RHS repeat-associated protein
VRTNDNKLSLMLGDEQGSTNVMMPVHVVADANGTTAHLAPATLADAQASTRTSYTPYGQLRGADNLAVDRGWLGQVEDRVVGTGATSTGTGLTYLNARYYDPATSRFISPDPLMNPGDPKTLDPYRYADNNPVVFTDATGLDPHLWKDGTAVGVPMVGSVAQPKWDLSLHGLRSAELHGLKGVGKGLLNLVLGATPIPGLVNAYTQGKAYLNDPTGTRNANFANLKSHWDQYFESGMRWDAWVVGKGSFGDAWHATTHSWMTAHIGENWDHKDLNAIMETGGEGGTYLTAAIATPEILGGLGAEGVAADGVSVDAAADAPKQLPLDRPISRSPAQNQVAWDRVAELQDLGAEDIRLNQAQVNAEGAKVGTNRPDLQFTLDGTRYYEEFESPGSNRGPGHLNTIFEHDPNGVASVFLDVG